MTVGLQIVVATPPGSVLVRFAYTRDAAGDTANAYDSPTGERVAADGELGLYALMDKTLRLSDVRYDLKSGTVLLFGALRWARLNLRRYVQILWIPIPVGEVRSQASSDSS